MLSTPRATPKRVGTWLADASVCILEITGTRRQPGRGDARLAPGRQPGGKGDGRRNDGLDAVRLQRLRREQAVEFERAIDEALLVGVGD